jgi:serine protease AprX
MDPFVMAVGAEDPNGTVSVRDDTLLAFSARGDGTRNPDLVAPGKSLQGLRVPGSYIDQTYPTGRINDRFFRGSGTSQAAALVSGAAALVIQQRPHITPDQLKALLTSTAQELPAADARGQGAGMISLRNALRTPTTQSRQTWKRSTGVGSLEAARGGNHLVSSCVPLQGERDIFGRKFNAAKMAAATLAHRTWSRGVWNGSAWTGRGWSANEWSANEWSGNEWSGNEWSANEWSANEWSANEWSGNEWSANEWSANEWSGNEWSGNEWSGVGLSACDVTANEWAGTAVPAVPAVPVVPDAAPSSVPVVEEAVASDVPAPVVEEPAPSSVPVVEVTVPASVPVVEEPAPSSAPVVEDAIPGDLPAPDPAPLP